MSSDAYFDVVLQANDGSIFPWSYSQLQRHCPYLEGKAVAKKYDDLKMILTLPYSHDLVYLITHFDESFTKYKWINLEFALEDMREDKDFQGFADKLLRYALRNINIRNCIGIWRKLLIMRSPLAEEAFRYILYRITKGVIEKTICLQFYRGALIFGWYMFCLRWRLQFLLLTLKIFESIWCTVKTLHGTGACSGRNIHRDKLLGTVRRAGLSPQKLKSFNEKLLSNVLSGKPLRPPRDQMVMFGGWHTGRTHSRIDIFDQDKQSWRPLCELSLVHPIAYHGSVVLNDELYVIGGTDGENHYSTVMKMNMRGEWKEVAPMFETRTYISNSCCVLDGMIYVCGGFDVRGIHQRRRNDRLRCVERYDPKTNKWERIPSMIQMRSDAAAVSAGGKVYVSGGFNGTEVLTSVEVYTPGTNTWIEVSNMPAPRSGHCMLLYNPHTLIVLGGFNGQDRVNTVFTWTIGHLSWTENPAMKSNRSNFAACLLKEDLIVAGGYSASKTISGVEKFDGKQWTDLPDLPANRSAMKILILPDFRDFALSKLGTDEDQKKWMEEDTRAVIEKSISTQRIRNEGEPHHLP
ncbi:BACK domain-containing protein [Trichostrongylus colubriformis]|uniref:BACK domain-containing protein n=1 Tax=Trichostrongylus colubriformis TaxID=6319 RepID=A0AAN8J1R2_TRICO